METLEEKIALLLRNSPFTSENRRIKEIVYKTLNENSKLIEVGRNEYLFDREKFNLLINEYNSNKIVFRKIVYKYDEEQNRLEVCHYAIDNVPTYDKNREIINISPSENEALKKKEFYSYDEKENIVKCETYERDWKKKELFLSRKTEYRINFEK